MSDFLPDELIDKILMKLPVKEVLVSKAVCKRWQRFMSHPNFARSHFESQNHPTRSLLLAVSSQIPQLESLQLERLPFGDYHNRASAVKFTCPVTRPNADAILLGSCNGLVCACLHYHEFHIWNPSTGDWRLLASPPFPSGIFHLKFHGFGYVSATQDYKLIVSADYHDPEDYDIARMHVQLFSVKENRWWTKSMEAPFGSVVECQGVNVEEKLHWVTDDYFCHLGEAVEDDDLPLVCFDLEREEFKRLRLPNLDIEGYDECGSNYSVALFSCDGILCLWHYGTYSATGFVEFWAMEKYGESDTWIRRYTFHLSAESPISFLKPLIITEMSKIFVSCSEEQKLELVRRIDEQEEEERVLYMNEWGRGRGGYARECGMIVYDHTLLWHGIWRAENQSPEQEVQSRKATPQTAQRDSDNEEEPLLCAVQE